ncbi:MAG: glycosyltransferase [Butyrivibrio sp.]|nr:glycosyltransferase [Butyrivibrio sp.]
MLAKELISVIIPVYNVGNYLERCVESVCKQSYLNIEIILVDDGSTDDSGKICDEFGKVDDRIKVIHQTNKGLAGARNTGIDASRGEYLCFVDSDDYVHPDYVKYLYEICVDNHCQIGICGHCATDRMEKFHEVDWGGKVLVCDRKQIFDDFYSENHVPIVIAWNKIYSRECIGNIRYDEGFIHEDEATTFKYLYNAKRIAWGKERLYYYFDRTDSITGQEYSKKRLDILKAYENRLEFYSSHAEQEYYERECQFYLSEILNNYHKVYLYLQKDKELLGMLKSKYQKAYLNADRSNWTVGRKMLYGVCYAYPLFYAFLKRKKI